MPRRRLARPMRSRITARRARSRTRDGNMTRLTNIASATNDSRSPALDIGSFSDSSLMAHAATNMFANRSSPYSRCPGIPRRSTRKPW